MRIAMVCPYDWCVEGGVKTHIRQLAGYFREWGHEVTIFAPASDEEQAAGECAVMGRPMTVRAHGSVQRITFAWKSPRVKAVLSEGSFDVLHLHEPLMPLLPYHFLRYSSAANVGTFHAAREDGSRLYSYTRPLTRRWFRKLDGKIAVSPAAASLVSRYFAGYFNIIPNGIDYDRWAQPRERRADLPPDKKTILFVGRPEKRKGLKHLLRAFLRIRETRDDVRLVVVGAGNFGRYERLMREATDVMFRPHVPYEELPSYHHSADVFCAPNTGNESQGYVLMEAMAAGLPTVASNIEGFAGVATHELDALLVRPKDDEALAAAITRLLDNPEFARRLGRAAAVQAETYSWEKVAHRVLSYYERLVYEREQVAEVRARRPAAVES